ncbi:MAG: multi-sensor signal transduction histidine kinase, partial [Chloroflexi bacterium]|nr:multi-sensor signal transduction histidine kinase [Chloroflexota bacterium]
MKQHVETGQPAGASWIPPRFYGRLRRIGPRLLAAFLLVIVPTVVIGVFAVQRLDTLAGQTTNLSTHDLPEIVIIDHLRTLLFQQQSLEQVAWSNQRLQAPIAAEIEAQANALRKLESTNTSDSHVRDRALIESLIAGITRGHVASKRIEQLVAAGNIAPAQTLEEQRLLPLINAGVAVCGRLKAVKEAEAAATAASVHRNTSTATRVVLLLTLLSVPLSAILAFLMTRSLQRPLSALLRATTALAAGDLQASPRLRSSDEIGQLADAFDTMRVNLRATIAALAIERQQTQAVIDSCADGMILVDAEHTVLQINPAAEYLTGCRASEALGRVWWEICGCSEKPAWVDLLPDQAGQDRPYHISPDCPHHPENPQLQASCALCRRELSVGTSAERASYQMLVQLQSGEERWLAVSCAAIPGDPEVGGRRLVVSLHDV